MGLIVWLPLTESINNQGTSGAIFKTNGAVKVDGGKIGACYQLD